MRKKDPAISAKLAPDYAPKRDALGHYLPGEGGRPKGVPNKDLREAKAVAEKILLGNTPHLYIQNVAQRIRQGEAPHMERFFAEHLWGKPRENIHLNLTLIHLLAVRNLSDLELSAFLNALDQEKPDEAMKLLPEHAA